MSQEDEAYQLPAGAPLGFPNCPRCPYVVNGPVHVCTDCAARTFTPVPVPHCEVCFQALGPYGVCANRLCSDPDRAIESVAAVAMFTEPLADMIRGFKTNPGLTRGKIFGRLVLGWLQRNVRPEQVDLIVANPTYSSTSALGHTEMVLAHAWREDLFGDYPISGPGDPVLIKTAETVKSKGAGLAGKKAAAEALAGVLALDLKQASLEGTRVIVYDDVLTTGAQLDAVARFLKDHGAASVRGLVLARVPWKY